MNWLRRDQVRRHVRDALWIPSVRAVLVALLDVRVLHRIAASWSRVSGVEPGTAPGAARIAPNCA